MGKDKESQKVPAFGCGMSVFRKNMEKLFVSQRYIACLFMIQPVFENLGSGFFFRARGVFPRIRLYILPDRGPALFPAQGYIYYVQMSYFGNYIDNLRMIRK